ncbi:MAG: hypothetical protein IKL10_02110 [Clostridia bacterium]|nr:hypothetical protein [Clostridia bacterium]
MSEQIELQKQDLTYLNWAKVRNSSGTAGTFLKAYSEIAGQKTYYKLSDFDTLKGIIGHESVNEIIVDRLLTLLGIEHLSYRLIYADIILDGKICPAYVCASDDFKQKGEDKIALDTYYELEHIEGEKPFDFCVRLGWEKYIYEMLVVDFLILNRDRHGANIEVLRNTKKKTLRLAPLFDHGLSLLFSCKNNKALIDKTDVLEDKRVQCYVGSNSAYENLNLIPKDKMPDFKIPSSDEFNTIFENIDKILPQELLDKIRELIWRRLKFYEDFRNQK